MNINEMTIEDAQEAVIHYGFKIIKVAEARKKSSRYPKGIKARVNDMLDICKKDGSKPTHVIFDTEDKSDGWVLVGKLDFIVHETLEYILNSEPTEGPLAKN